MTRNKISIVIVTYCPSDVRYELCKRSFAEFQNTGIDREDYELIVFNNGGIHDDLVASLNTDIILSADRNIGVGAAFNAGISVTIGTVLALMQDDLGYKEGWLKRGLEILKRYPNDVVALMAADNNVKLGEVDEDCYYSRKSPMAHIMTRKLFCRVGEYRNNIYSPGGEWIKRLIRGGSKFVHPNESYIRHIGAGLSIIGSNRAAIREYRGVHEG